MNQNIYDISAESLAASEMIEAMEKEVHRLMRTLKILKSKVRRDDLTGLLRRDEFFADLAKTMQQGQGANLSILMLDVDNFKQLNDQEGHQAGDVALQRIAGVISRCAHTGATVGRYGGEEFIVAVCGSELLAKALGEAIRRQVAKEVGVTVSVGIASAHQAEFEASRMVAIADKALAHAKQAGKNQVVSAAA